MITEDHKICDVYSVYATDAHVFNNISVYIELSVRNELVHSKGACSKECKI